MSRSRGDVVIIGAGLIGLGIAFELAQRGAVVRVFDTGEVAKGASWAGAGMLTPFGERITDGAMRTLCEASLAEYPAFVQRVREASGVDPHLRLDGVLSAAFSSDEFEALRLRAKELRARARAYDLYDRAQTLRCEPALGKHVVGSLLVHDEGQIDNRRLGRALAAACTRRGVTVQGNVRSLCVECDERRVLGVRTDLGFVPAAAVVNAAGAWAADVAGLPPSVVPPVRPVKGQMLALAIPKGFFRHTLWVHGAYLVPRHDGRLLIGATVEEARDARVSADGLHGLLHAALTAVPALGEFAVTETWAGLRPGTPDDRPILGATVLEGYFLATGHYRNGILLTPVTARLVVNGIAQGGEGELRPFSLDRFAVVPRQAAGDMAV